MAQMTNRFPHFLIYTVLIWALLLFHPPPGLPLSQLRAHPRACTARGKVPNAPYRSMSSSTNSGVRARWWEGTLGSSRPSQEGSQELCPGHTVWGTTTAVQTLTSLLGQLLLPLPTGWYPSFGLWALTGHTSSSLPGCLPKMGTRKQRALCTGGVMAIKP